MRGRWADGGRKKRRKNFCFSFSESVVWVADHQSIKGSFDSSLCGNIITSVNPDRLSPHVSLDSLTPVLNASDAFAGFVG